MIKNIIKILWIFLAVIVLACVTVFFSIAKGWIGYMPPVEDLENPNYKFATQVFSEDGKVLGTYSFSKENRVYVGYNDLSPNVINALIATEDVRFAEHSGIDAIGKRKINNTIFASKRDCRLRHFRCQRIQSSHCEAWFIIPEECRWG